MELAKFFFGVSVISSTAANVHLLNLIFNVCLYKNELFPMTAGG